MVLIISPISDFESNASIAFCNFLSLVSCEFYKLLNSIMMASTICFSF
jgi:hypothetical protein